MIEQNIKTLDHKICFTRSKLEKLIIGEKGVNDKIIRISQELDELISTYQRLIRDQE